MTPVDYVIPYVDGADQEWQHLYRKYATNDTLCIQRYRNYDTLKYQLRGIERNLPWVHNVYVIVQSESQIPKWLRTDNTRLRLVYHHDYIPESELPAFKSGTIELNIHRIVELSENFILANDDMIPVKPQPLSNYFIDGRPVQTCIENIHHLQPHDDNIHKFMLYRMMRIEQMYLHNPSFRGLAHHHLLCPYSKSFWDNTVRKYKYTLAASRHEQFYRGMLNMSHWLISDLQVLNGLSIINNNLNTTGIIDIEDNTKPAEIYDIIDKANVICLNDHVNENTAVLNEIPYILDTVFPEKSTFEE